MDNTQKSYEQGLEDAKNLINKIYHMSRMEWAWVLGVRNTASFIDVINTIPMKEALTKVQKYEALHNMQFPTEKVEERNIVIKAGGKVDE